MKSPLLSVALGVLLWFSFQVTAYSDHEEDGRVYLGGRGSINFEELESFVERIMAHWHVPGLAVAIVEGNNSYYKGFGWASIGQASVTPVTLFHVGGVTMSFVAAALSLFVDDDDYPQVQWDTPVVDILGDEFQLSDPGFTRTVTILDVLSHDTGYSPHGLMGWETPKDALKRLPHLDVAAPPHTEKVYSSLMYSIAGRLLEKLSGEQWLGDVLRQKLWAPMGLDHTMMSPVKGLSGDLDLADGHFFNNDSQSFIALPRNLSHVYEGASGAVTNILDLSRYLRAMIHESGPVSAAGHSALKARYGLATGARVALMSEPLFYGLGWETMDFFGNELWTTHGHARGHSTDLWMYPAWDFAIAVVSNLRSGSAELVRYKIMCDYFGLSQEYVDAIEELHKRSGSGVDKMSRGAEMCLEDYFPCCPDEPALRPFALEAYTGTYSHPGYGTIDIALQCEDGGQGRDEEETSSGDDGTPAHPTTEDGCCLAATTSLRYADAQVDLRLQHVRGREWVSWGYLREFKPESPFVHRPTLCMWTQFDADEGDEGGREDRGQMVKRVGIEIPGRGGQDLDRMTWFTLQRK